MRKLLEVVNITIFIVSGVLLAQLLLINPALAASNKLTITYKIKVAKIIERAAGGTLWCTKQKKIIVKLSRTKTKIYTSKSIIKRIRSNSTAKSKQDSIGKAVQKIETCASGDGGNTPTPPVTPTPTPSFTATPTPIPDNCRGDTILWNVGRANPVAEFNFDSAPHIRRDRIALLHMGWHGSLPDIVTDSADQRNRLNWIHAPYTQVGSLLYVNGGTPINGDLSIHIANLESHIANNYPANFDGYFVIDFEQWWPQWDFGQHTYASFAGQSFQDIAKAQVQVLRPDLTNDADITAEAKRLWELRGMEFYLETQRAIKRVRPNAKVAWYDLMIRSYHTDYLTSAGNNNRALNDLAQAIHNESDFVIADIYQFYSSAEDSNHAPLTRPSGTWTTPPNSTVWFEDNMRYVKGNVQEALRLANAAGGKPVMAYSWHRYHDSAPYGDRYRVLHRSDIFLELIYPLMLGATNVTIWGNEIINYPEVPYGKLQTYLDSTMGPMIEDYCNDNLANLQDLISQSQIN